MYKLPKFEKKIFFCCCTWYKKSAGAISTQNQFRNKSGHNFQSESACATDLNKWNQAFTARKFSKYGVFSGSYFPVFS